MEETVLARNTNSVSPERKKIGKILYVFAWIIEALAVSIGLSIAIMMMMTSFSEVQEGSSSQVANLTNVIIAGLPFIMVAAVEITKIPFTQAFYYTTKKRWKWVFGLSLAFIALITFESALNGFERNFTAMTYGIDKFKKELVAVDENIPLLQANLDRLSELTAEKIEEDYNSRQKQLSDERQTQVSVVQDRISGLRASIQSESAEIKRQEIEDKRNQIKSVYKRRDDELNLQNQNYQLQLEQVNSEVTIKRRTLQNQLTNAQNKLENAEKESREAIADASIFTVSATRERENARVASLKAEVEQIRSRLNSIDALNIKTAARENHVNALEQVRASYQQQISVLEDDLNSLLSQLNQMIGSRERDIETSITSHQSEIAKIENSFSLQRQENEKNRDRQYNMLENNSTNIALLDEQLNSLREERLSLRESINTKVADNQVFRMAQWAYGTESAADLKRDQVMLIALLWFGSLAALIAFTGIMLALSSCVIRDPKIKDFRDDKNTGSNSLLKMLDTIRRYYTYKRRVQRTPRIKEVPIEVIKEVPVDRVKLTEKPIEIIKKVLIHVPVYSNDEKLLKQNPEVNL